MAKPTTARFGKMRILLGEQQPSTPVAVTSLANANPATCAVAAADIGKFTNGMEVLIAGATGAGLVNANGLHTISSVGTPANSFTLTGVDTSAGGAPQTSGVTATPPGPIIYSAPCGFTTKNFALTKNLTELDIPDCDDPDAPSWIGRDVQNLTATISGDGVAAAESVPDWNAAAISTESVPMKVEIEFTAGMKSFTGDFIVDSLTFGAESGGRVTLAINAQSDGEIVDEWVPA